MPALITLRIIHKKMKPRVWFQIEVPSGITFSSLSILVDSAIGYPADPDGESAFALFEFHQYSSSMIFREGIFEDGSEAGYYFSLREANSTFIDEYLEVGDWISYTPDEWRTDQYRIEVKCITACDLPMTRMTKASKGAYEILQGNANWYQQRYEELSRYQIVYDDHFSFLTRNELFKQNRHEGIADSSAFLLPGMKSPVSKSDNSIDSASSHLNIIVDLFAETLLLKYLFSGNHTSLRECLFMSCSEEGLDRILEYFNIPPDSPIPDEILQQLDAAPVIDEILKHEKQSAAPAQPEDTAEAAEEKPENAAADDTRRDLVRSFFSVENIFKGRTESERARLIRKALLAASHLLEFDIMTQFFMKKNDRQMATFRKAAAECEKHGSFKPASFDESDDMAAFAEIDYVFFHKKGNECVIPSDVITAFREIDTPAFNQRRQQYVWLTDCLEVVQYYYGVIPINQFYKLYSQFGNLSKNEMLKTIRDMDDFDNPNEIIGNRLVYSGWVHDDEYKNLEKIQADKPFYFPSKAEVEDLSWNGYPTQQKEVKKLLSVCKKAFGLKGIDAADLVEQIWYQLNQGDQIHDIMDLINGRNLIFNSEQAMRQFIDAINDINNYSHLLYNRGQTPRSLMPSMLENIRRGGGLRIVPGSTMAAEMLEKIAPDLKQEGLHIDIDANASEIDSAIMDSSGELHTFKKKIYPNDPCPCGSGKKYKKCHGRK